ncbi:hypothetical protein [Candidatus Lokiarchaeum ossiferum]|uniref:hypothetical protein n=1 Tax=Candidatus Lokiarchaeum ossiferum TaxID=2951803 RepID=UPI00352BD40F
MFRQKKLLISGALGILFILMVVPLFITVGAAPQTTPASSSGFPKSSSASYNEIYIQNVSREIKVDSFGTVLIEDSYKIRNNNSNSIMTIDICLSDTNVENLIFHEASDLTSGPMKTQLLEEKLQGYNVLEILLSEPLLPYSSVSFTLNMVFKDALSVSLANSYYGYEAYLHPVCPYEVIEFHAFFLVPEGSASLYGEPEYYLVGQPTDYDGTFQEYYGENSAPFEEIINSFSYTNENAGPIRINSLSRHITINSWGYIRVVEQYRIVSWGKTPIYTLDFQIPQQAEHVRIFDDIGELGNGDNEDEPQPDAVQMGTSKNDDGTIDVSLLLYYNRAPMRQGNYILFSLEYELPVDDYVSSEYGKQSLKFDILTTKSDYVIDELSSTVELMGVSKLKNSNLNTENIHKTATSIVYETNSTGVSRFQENVIDVTYSVNLLLKMYRAIIFILLFAAIFSIYAVTRSRNPIEGEIEKQSETIPISELTQFVTLYEEKNALLIDIEKADSALIRRRIQKKAYSKTMKVLTSKLKELNEEIAPFKRILLQSNVDVKFIIQKLDYLEAEKMSVKDSINSLQEKYKLGKLPSKAAYEKLSEEMLKRTSSSQKKIDRYINELRAFTV